MSITGDAATSSTQPGTATINRASAVSVPWLWLVVACILLGGAVAVRGWQDQQFKLRLKVVEDTPFSLKTLPYTLGNWHAEEGKESTLDPEIVKMIGSTDYIVRDYVNKQTGSRLTVMVTFGRADATFGHVPQVCYPSAGFSPVEPPTFPTIETGHGPANFRSEVFAKSKGQTSVREEVYHSFRHNDRWSPSAIDSWKLFRVSPSMFKVQVQRRVIEHERRDEKNPTEQFLTYLVPEIERHLPRHSEPAAEPSTPSK